MDDHKERIEELLKDKMIASVQVADTKSISQGAIFNMYHSKAIGEAVLKNKKFRTVLEYDPENEKSLFYIKFDEPGVRMEVYPTKEAAEQVSKERIKAFPPGATINKTLCSISEAFCDSLLVKIESHCALAEINEMIRTLLYFEKTDTLPKAEKLNQIAVAFGTYVEKEVKKRTVISGESTFEMTDSIRCLHRLYVILWDMIYRKNSHSKMSVGASNLETSQRS